MFEFVQMDGAGSEAAFVWGMRPITSLSWRRGCFGPCVGFTFFGGLLQELRDRCERPSPNLIVRAHVRRTFILLETGPSGFRTLVTHASTRP